MSFLLLLPQLKSVPVGTSLEEGQDAITVEKPEDLAPVSTKQLVTLHNTLVPSTAISKFKDRKTANERLFKLLESGSRTAGTDDDPWNMANAPDSPERGDTATDTSPDVEETSTKEDNVATATASRRGAKSTRKKGAKGSTATKGATRGRAPGFAGAKLFRVGEENPCRTGGLRAQSWELIKPQGLSYEKYLEKGGRAQELAFNVRQGRVKVEFPKGAKNGSEE